MAWKSIDNINFKDPHEGIPLDEIFPLSERAVSHIARNRSSPVLKHAFVNIYGAIEMMQGLTYHHARFMSLVESCHTVAPRNQISEALRHEAVAYLNRLGQFWSFSKSDLVKEYCPSPESILPTIGKLIIFRNKHTAHRSIDAPRAEDSDDLQVMNAISLSILGGHFFHPKPGHLSPNLSLVPLNTEEDLDELKCNLYRNCYLGFQIYDIKNSMHVNFFLEQDYEPIMLEAYCLVNILVPPTSPTP